MKDNRTDALYEEDPTSSSADNREATEDLQAPEAEETARLDSSESDDGEGQSTEPVSAEDEDTAALQAAVRQKEQEAAENYNRYLRAQADLENLRRRSRQEREELLRYGAQRLLENLLPVLDNFERALASVPSSVDESDPLAQGLQMICRQLQQVVQSEGLSEIEAEGKPFDPNVHQAVMQSEVEGVVPGTVVEVLQKGYRLHEKVLRPAMVKVSK